MTSVRLPDLSLPCRSRPGLPVPAGLLLLAPALSAAAACARPPAAAPRPGAPPCDAVWIEAQAPTGPHPPALVDLTLAVAGQVCYRDWLSGRIGLAGWIGDLCPVAPAALGPGPVEVELTLRTPPVPRVPAVPPLGRLHLRCTAPEPD